MRARTGPDAKRQELNCESRSSGSGIKKPIDFAKAFVGYRGVPEVRIDARRHPVIDAAPIAFEDPLPDPNASIRLGPKMNLGGAIR